jgi:hypothetical protein
VQNAKEILRLGKTHIIFVFFCELFARLFVTFAIYYLFSDDDAAAGANALKLTIDKIDRSLAMPLFRTIPKDNILKKTRYACELAFYCLLLLLLDAVLT